MSRHPFSCLAGALLALACWADPASAQTVRGVVRDASRDGPVSLAGVYLLDRDRGTVDAAMADSLGHYAVTIPETGEYFLVATRYGYRDMESPLLAISGSRDYDLDLELQPEPFGLAPINVTVRNDQAIDWLKKELGGNPVQMFGFRLLQGDRLEEAKVKGKYRPTETLRWLYIPVSHAGECVSINAFPRATTMTSQGPRNSGFERVPGGTRVIEDGSDVDFALGPRGCGTLLVNDREVPTSLIDDVDMRSIALVVTLPGSVRLYTYDFNWAFR